MTTSWRKAIRDLGRERMRSATIVVALALGIAGFQAVLSSYAILTGALNDGYAATNPASFTISTDRVDDDVLRAVRAVPGIGDVEARRVVRGRIKAGPAEWRNLELFVVRDYGDVRVSTIAPERGAWPPATGDILIERDALGVARASIGDVVTVRTSEGDDHELRLTGTVHDVGQAQARMENLVYGYITLDTLVVLGEQPYLDRLKCRVADRPLDPVHIREVATNVESALDATHHEVRNVDIPTPGQHPHAQIMGLLLMSMAVFGLFIVALSGVLVFNVVTALMAAEVRQIGVMKAIGGSRWQVARIYLAEAAVLGVVAIAIAAPIGIVGGRALCRAMAVFLNFDIASFAVPIWVYLLVALVGVVAPLAAAALPVWLGTRVSVREALSYYGVADRAFGSSALETRLSAFGGLRGSVLLALRNTVRKRLRLVLTLTTLTAAGVFFMSALDIRASMVRMLDDLFATRRYDLSVSLANPYPIKAVEAAAMGAPGVAKAEAWIVADGTIPVAGREPVELTAIGVPSGSTLLGFDLTDGHGLRPDEPDTIVLNSVVATKMGRIAVGDAVDVVVDGQSTRLTVAGLAREPFSPSIAYVSRAFFDSRPEAGTSTSVRIVSSASDAGTIAAMRNAVDRSFEAAHIKVSGSSTKADNRFGFDQHMVMIYVFLVVVSCVLGAVGALGLMTTMTLNITERRRELGVLRAIGATPVMLATIVGLEAVAIGLTGWIASTAISWPVSKAIGDLLLGLLFRTSIRTAIEPVGVGVWLLVSIVLSVAASALPAWRASTRSVREALEYE